MELHLLGPVEATLNGRPIPLGATKQRAVLVMLALQANATVSVDRLVDGLWGEVPPATAPKMVQLYVSQLRRLLGGEGAQIVTHGRGYELRVAPEAIDAARFERLVDEAGRSARAPNDAAREALEEVRPEAGLVFGDHDYREHLAKAAGKALPKEVAERFCGAHLRSARLITLLGRNQKLRIGSPHPLARLLCHPILTTAALDGFNFRCESWRQGTRRSHRCTRRRNPSRGTRRARLQARRPRLCRP